MKKVIICLLAVCLAVGTLVYEGFQNKFNFIVSPSKTAAPKTSQSTSISPSDSKSNDEAAKKAAADKASEEQAAAQKALDNLWQKGQDLYSNHNYAEAIATENEVLAKDPNYYKAYTTIGIAQCYSHKYDDGMKNLDKALSIKGDYGYGLYNKALALELYGHYNEALEWYNKALSVEKFVWSYYGMASIYGRYGDVQNSVKYLKLAAEMNPDVKGCAKDEPDFNNVKNSKEFKELVNN